MLTTTPSPPPTRHHHERSPPVTDRDHPAGYFGVPRTGHRRLERLPTVTDETTPPDISGCLEPGAALEDRDPCSSVGDSGQIDRGDEQARLVAELSTHLAHRVDGDAAADAEGGGALPGHPGLPGSQ